MLCFRRRHQKTQHGALILESNMTRIIYMSTMHAAARQKLTTTIIRARRVFV